MTYRKKDKSKRRKIKVGRTTTLFIIQPSKNNNKNKKNEGDLTE